MLQMIFQAAFFKLRYGMGQKAFDSFFLTSRK
jgi:hypothetical protein